MSIVESLLLCIYCNVVKLNFSNFDTIVMQCIPVAYTNFIITVLAKYPPSGGFPAYII